MNTASPIAGSSAETASTSTQPRSPIVLSEAWKQLHLTSPSGVLHTPPGRTSTSKSKQKDDPDADSSDDGFLSDHSEELDPETGFDPFLAATRRARQHSSSSLLVPQPTLAPVLVSPNSEASGSATSPATSSESVLSNTSAVPHQDQQKQSEAYRWSRAAKYWSKVVDEVMFETKQPKQGMIDLSNKSLTEILPSIADLSRFVALPPPRYDRDDDADDQSNPEPQHLLQSKSGGLVRHESYLAPFSAHIHNDTNFARTNSSSAKRTLSRSQSAFQPSLGRAQSFARTSSAMSALSSRSAGSYRDHRDRQATLSVFLGSNSLTRLPSALFQLQNLRVLSLRSNKLKFLPPAIGDLHNLSELHVPNNKLQYLPAEILRLKLVVFTWFPNPYLIKPPKTGVLTVRPLLCHRAQRIRQQHSLNNLSEMDEEEDADDDASSTTPVRIETDAGDVDSVPVSQQPPPLIRAPAPNTGRQQRHMDRTRSEMQVQGFLARGIDQLRVGTFDSISEDRAPDDASIDDNSTDPADTTVDADDTASQIPVTQPSTEEGDEAEQERQRILEAAFADEDGVDAFDLTSSTDFAPVGGKVAGRSRVLGAKQIGGVPSLQELCIRKLLSPYDVAEAESQGIASPFLSPVVQTVGGAQRRRSSSRTGSCTGTPLFEAQQRTRATCFGSNASRTRSFSSNGGPEDSKFGKRVPTLLEAYENGTLQSLVGELGHGLVPMLEAARRSATQDWGTRVRVRSSSAAARKAASDRKQSNASHTKEELETHDVFGGVDVPGSLDRGDDACNNPWFSRCPNPKHCGESQTGRGGKRKGDIALHRGKRGFGSTSSVSSLGTTLGAGKGEGGSVGMERASSTAASSDSGVVPASPLSSSASSSVGTTGGFTSSGPSRPESQVGSLPFSGQHVRFANTQRNFASSGLGRASSMSTGRGSAFGAERGMMRPASTNFVRGFSSSSALSASGLNRSSSFGPGADDSEDAERDWPLTEQEHRQAPIFNTPGETRIEWISHIGGIRVAKLGEAQVELSDDSNNASSTADGEQPSMLGAMGGFENKDLLPIMWRGCSRGCLDFLV